MESPEFEKLTDKEYELMEGLFPHYLFYNTLANGDRVFVCSRCRNEFIRQKIKRTITPDDRKIMCAAHGDLGRCPICGAVVTIKNTGKSRTCKNLQHSEKVVVLHAVNRDRVEARCYIVGKNYEQSYKPCLDIYEKSRYLLTPGKAIKFTRDYYSDNFFSVNTVGEPFPKAGMFYCVNEGYTVFGLDRLKGTFLEYNQLDSFISVDAQYYNGYIYTSPIMKYLSYFAMYPQLEMLQKLGHFDVVGKLVNANKKSFPYVNWKATSITGFFKMNKQEYRSFRKNGETLGLLRTAYKIRPGKDRLDFEKAKIYLDCFGDEFNVERFISDVNEARIPLKPVFTGKVPDGANYAYRCEWWELDSKTGAMSTDFGNFYENKFTAFEAGKTYHYGVYVTTVYGDNYVFGPDTKLKINGEFVNYKRYEGDTSDGSDGTMWVITDLTMTPQTAGTTPDYKIIEGANGTWTKNTDGTLTFRANGDFSAFMEVKVDGNTIPADKYTAASGSTVITMKRDYLDTLSAGKHILTIVYSDGVCSTEFEIKEQQTVSNTPAKSEDGKATESKPNDSGNRSPKTGDSVNPVLLMFTMLFAVGIIECKRHLKGLHKSAK